jgi:hypothetical protein
VSICSTTSKAVAEHGQAFVEVELDDVHAPAHAGQHVGVVDLDAVAAAAAFALQVVEHAAVAAAQVEHARAFGHEARQGLHGGFLGHACSFAMLSK